MPLASRLEGVSFAYPGGPLVLEDVDLAVEEGEFVAIAGPNGGGKTTLLRLILGLSEPTRGQAFLFGEPATRLARRSLLGYLPQRTQLGIDAPISVGETVAAGRVARRGVFSRWTRRDEQAVAEALERVGLQTRRTAPLRTLSGGQQQRVVIAQALAGVPRLLVLDEPTAGVDVDSQEALAELLEELHRDLEVTILYVSHEFGAVEHFVERLLLVRGRIVFDGPPTKLPELWHDPAHVHS
jgi:zinc transport system ATP-binding protein